jgi:hypothetical protein
MHAWRWPGCRHASMAAAARPARPEQECARPHALMRVAVDVAGYPTVAPAVLLFINFAAVL